MRGNLLIKRFRHCSDQVKIKLFKSYCNWCLMMSFITKPFSKLSMFIHCGCCHSCHTYGIFLIRTVTWPWINDRLGLYCLMGYLYLISLFISSGQILTVNRQVVCVWEGFTRSSSGLDERTRLICAFLSMVYYIRLVIDLYM